LSVTATGGQATALGVDTSRQQGQSISPYDFTTGSRFKCGATNADLYRIFMTGLDGTPMPAWSDWVTPTKAGTLSITFAPYK